MAYRILVVDDDRSIIKMIKDFLEMEEYHVDTALNGEDALRKAETHPDLIILDINLPSMNGIEVCKKIRDFVDCPILFLTARIEERDKITGEVMIILLSHFHLGNYWPVLKLIFGERIGNKRRKIFDMTMICALIIAVGRFSGSKTRLN